MMLFKGSNYNRLFKSLLGGGLVTVRIIIRRVFKRDSAAIIRDFPFLGYTMFLKNEPEKMSKLRIRYNRLLLLFRIVLVIFRRSKICVLFSLNSLMINCLLLINRGSIF